MIRQISTVINPRIYLMNVLNKHAPFKEKLIRGNNATFMNKTLSKAFMHGAKSKKYNKNPIAEN